MHISCTSRPYPPHPPAPLVRYERAHQLYEQALSLRHSLLGPDHPDTIDSVYNLAGVQYNMKQYEKVRGGTT